MVTGEIFKFSLAVLLNEKATAEITNTEKRIDIYPRTLLNNSKDGFKYK